MFQRKQDKNLATLLSIIFGFVAGAIAGKVLILIELSKAFN